MPLENEMPKIKPKFYAEGEHSLLRVLARGPVSAQNLAEQARVSFVYAHVFVKRLRADELLDESVATPLYALAPGQDVEELIVDPTQAETPPVRALAIDKVFDQYFEVDESLPKNEWMNAMQMLACIPEFAASATHPMSRRLLGVTLRKRGVHGEIRHGSHPKTWPVRPAAL